MRVAICGLARVLEASASEVPTHQQHYCLRKCLLVVYVNFAMHRAGIQYEAMPKKSLAPVHQPEVPPRGDTECGLFCVVTEK